jgi:hypothetical protein
MGKGEILGFLLLPTRGLQNRSHVYSDCKSERAGYMANGRLEV